MSDTTGRLSTGQIQQLRRLTTPTIYNGWELITSRNIARECFNLEPVVDFFPHAGPMVGYAVTVVVQVGGPRRTDNREAWGAVRSEVASLPGPKILVIQDIDKPHTYGSVFGEVSGNTFRSLGCVGAIIDGGVRDIDEVRRAGFKTLGRQACVGHGVGTLVRSNCEVNVFGTSIQPGQLIHADQHGFLAIPREDEAQLLRAATFLDAAESSLLHAARDVSGKTTDEYLKNFDRAIDVFVKEIKDFSAKRGEW